MNEKILDIFRKNPESYISGEDISQRLGISRTALWKHIEKLREKGYDFVATPHLGYRLIKIPDRLFADEIRRGLKSKIIGKDIVYFDKTDSTNTQANILAEKNCSEGTVVVAEHQTKGRGRLSRAWASPRFKGIYFSIVLRPKMSLAEVSKITLLAAVAVASTIRKHTHLTALIKWPNDILIGGKKVCGILTEMNAEVDKINYITLGIGINVNAKKFELPSVATSLSQEGADNIVRIDLLRALLEEFDDHYALFKKGNFESIIQEWKDMSATLGRRVKVVLQNEKIEGQAAGIDADGALILRLDNGFQKKITAGDVTLLR